MDWFVIPLATCLALVAVSLAAVVILPANARLPMQWGLNGKPTWYASKLVALSFTPILACIVFAALLAPMLLGEDGTSKPNLDASMRVAAGIFLIVHVIHVWLAIRHVKRQASR